MSLEKLTLEDICGMLRQICGAVLAREEEFCRLDSGVGDGDHGVTMTRGFSNVREGIGGGRTIQEELEAAGGTLAASMGGAIGPIYGTFFTELGSVYSEATAAGLAEFSAGFARALEEIKDLADVREGQKTLVDALSPAAQALARAEGGGLTLAEALRTAAQAAQAGAEATREMMAGKGRAKFLKEKSIGFQDAGASSMAVVIGAIADYVGEGKAQ